MYKCGAGAGDGSKHPPPLEIHNVHGLERSQWPCQWLVMYKCGAGAGDGSKHPPTPNPYHPLHPYPTYKHCQTNTNGSKERIIFQMNSHDPTY